MNGIQRRKATGVFLSHFFFQTGPSSVAPSKNAGNKNDLVKDLHDSSQSSYREQFICSNLERDHPWYCTRAEDDVVNGEDSQARSHGTPTGPGDDHISARVPARGITHMLRRAPVMYSRPCRCTAYVPADRPIIHHRTPRDVEHAWPSAGQTAGPRRPIVGTRESRRGLLCQPCADPRAKAAEA
ncbi:hypothetical protein SEVIR_4G021066v4 [Setaria viridis]